MSSRGKFCSCLYDHALIRVGGVFHAYWSSSTHDFVPFLIGVKNKYDPSDLFKFAQSVPLAL
jgi:Berberine and berberine like